MRYSLLLLIALLFSSCGTTTTFMLTSDKPCCKGQIIDDRYSDPQGLFSLKMPIMSGRQIQEQCLDPNSSHVTFMGDMGSLVRIEVIKNPPDLCTDLINKDALQTLFRVAVFEQIKRPIPSASFIVEEYIDEDGEGLSYFALLDLPGADTLADANTGQRFDGKRGFLFFFEGDASVILSYHLPDWMIKFHKGHEEDLQKLAKDNLLEIRKSFKLTCPQQAVSK